MKRKFIFTEEQIKKIMGENFVAYLNKDDAGTGFNDNSIDISNNQIKPEEDSDDNPVTTNKFAKDKIPHYSWFRRSYNALYEGKKKILNDNGDIVPDKCDVCGAEVRVYIKGEPVYLCSNHKCNKYFGTMVCNINERNQYLNGQNFKLGKNTNDMIDNIANVNTSDKMINNMSNDKNTPLATHYTRLNRIKNMKKNDPVRYNNINGNKLEKSLKSTIENAKQIGQSLKNTEVNALKFDVNSDVNTKKGHHKDGATITYYEKN